MIRVRIPPSPTGLLHIGTVRTALYNYLFAKRSGGTMVLRIEDTDKERGTKEFEDDIVNGLVKLGIAGDEGLHVGGKYGPYRQSERTEIYKGYLKLLLDEDKAYYCGCSKERLEQMRTEQMANKQAPRYDKTCADKKLTEGVIRLRVPSDRDMKWEDLVRGETVIQSKELDDYVIARNIEDPLYHLTVVADDHDMLITHIIRGEDHIANTPKQMLLFEAFGWEIPAYAHLPLILNEDKSKLSKRKNKVSVDDYLAEGYLPEALLNFLALLGWNTPDEQEIFSLEELVEKFSLDRVHKGGAVFDLKKLEWINGEYIKKMIAEDVDGFYERYLAFMGGVSPFNNFDKSLVKKILKDPDFDGRFKKLSDITEEIRILAEFNMIANLGPLILNERFNIKKEDAKLALSKAIDTLNEIEWNKGDGSKFQEISDSLSALPNVLNMKNGQVLWPIRAALSGREKSPNFATLAIYLGKEETLKRLEKALNMV